MSATKNETHMPSSYQMNKELNSLYSQLEVNKKKLSIDRANLYGKVIVENRPEQRNLSPGQKDTGSSQPKLHTLSPYDEREYQAEGDNKELLERSDASFRLSKFNQEEYTGPVDQPLYSIGSAKLDKMRHSVTSGESTRVKDVYIDTAPALLGDQSPIDLHELYNDNANKKHKLSMDRARNPDALSQSYMSGKKAKAAKLDRSELDGSRSTRSGRRGSNDLGSDASNITEDQFAQERLYRKMYDIKKQQKQVQSQVVSGIKKLSNRPKISQNSQKIMDRRVESKLALVLSDIDKDKTRRLNFEQFGRVMTVLGIFRVVVYNEHYELEGSGSVYGDEQASNQKRRYEEMMIHEQLWLLLANYKDTDFIDAEIVFIVVKLLMDNIKETPDILAVDIQECLYQHQQRNPGINDMLADDDVETWGLPELIRRFRKLGDSRLTYAKTGYLKPAKVEEFKQTDKKMSFKPYVSENSNMIDAVKTHRFLQETSTKQSSKDQTTSKGFKLDTIDQLIQDFKKLDRTFKKEPPLYGDGEEDSQDIGQPKGSTDRPEILFRRHEQRKQWQIEAEKKRKEDELKDCTFAPNINRNYRFTNRPSAPTFDRLYNHSKVQKKREEDSLMEQVEKETRELDECTFNPRINNVNLNVLEVRHIPKGFDKSIGRLRFGHEIHEKKKEALEGHSRGENYEKLRNQKVKPFSFLQDQRTKRKIPFVYIDVNVGPGKSGRIGIHEDDNPIELARNFALTFQLNQEMTSSLEELLTTQLENYYAAAQNNNQPQHHEQEGRREQHEGRREQHEQDGEEDEEEEEDDYDNEEEEDAEEEHN